MYRFVSFIVIFSFVSILLFFHHQNSHFSSAEHHDNQHYSTISIPETHDIPTITGSITQDPSGSWLLKLETIHFEFTPEKIGIVNNTYNEGHAHLYINGEKINRLYGMYYNIGELKSGITQIKVTLNSNNHRVFATHDGEEIAFNQTIIVP